jgi:hypothetical protein
MVSDNSIVLIIALKLSDKVWILNPNRQMPIVPTPLHYSFEGSSKTILGRLAFDNKAPFPSFPPVVGEPNEVKYPWLWIWSGPSLVGGLFKASKVYQPCLLWMEAQTKSHESLREYRHYLLGIFL